jgi:hypothetical protein
MSFSELKGTYEAGALMLTLSVLLETPAIGEARAALKSVKQNARAKAMTLI